MPQFPPSAFTSTASVKRSVCFTMVGEVIIFLGYSAEPSCGSQSNRPLLVEEESLLIIEVVHLLRMYRLSPWWYNTVEKFSIFAGYIMTHRMKDPPRMMASDVKTVCFSVLTIIWRYAQDNIDKKLILCQCYCHFKDT